MQRKPKKPAPPAERHETVRREIAALLAGRTLSAKDISMEVHIPEKAAYEHLEHIRRSMLTKERRFTVVPAECKKCGFVFRKRERLTKPGKCPVCKSEAVREPLFTIEA